MTGIDGGDAPDAGPRAAATSLPVSRALDLSGRVALVTGGTSGIGAGIAERLAEAGAAIAVAARHADDGPEGTCARIRRGGGIAEAIEVDVSDEAAVRRAVNAAVDSLGRLDILVNCAGVQPVGSFLALSASDWDEMLETNARGVFLCTREVARVFVASGTPGSIVNIASIEGLQPAAGHSHYSASKAAVLMHTRAAALELGDHQIRVNAVSPGLVRRAGLEDDWPDGMRRWLAKVPLGRLVEPDDVADAVLYLVSPMARFVTGVNLVVDGGILALPTW